MGDLFADVIGPLLSRGSPSEFTTLPSNSSPTGTSRILPVHLTTSPSEIDQVLSRENQ
jgi:hypothetical protein